MLEAAAPDVEVTRVSPTRYSIRFEDMFGLFRMEGSHAQLVNQLTAVRRMLDHVAGLHRQKYVDCPGCMKG